MKVYIQFDFEGIAGFVIRDNQDRNIPTVHERVKRLMHIATAEVTAAAEGALEAGAKEVVVWDSHGEGNTLLVEELPMDVELITGDYPRAEWLPFFDGTDVGIYIGGHAMTGTPRAVTPHTMIEVNGVSYGEVGMFVLECGSQGVPVVMISGDSAVKREIAPMASGAEFVVTKDALGPTLAKTITPAKSCELIHEAALRGVEWRSEIQPYTVKAPFVFRAPGCVGAEEPFTVEKGELLPAYRRFLKERLGYAKGWPDYHLRAE